MGGFEDKSVVASDAAATGGFSGPFLALLKSLVNLEVGLDTEAECAGERYDGGSAAFESANIVSVRVPLQPNAPNSLSDILLYRLYVVCG